MNKTLKYLFYAMIASILLTASPILLLANYIEPRVFGMPFFLFWSMVPSFILTVLCIIYSAIANKLDESNSVHK